MNRKAILYGCLYSAPCLVINAVPYVLSTEATYWSGSLVYWLLFGLSAYFVLMFSKDQRDDYAD
ncbi:hypothetical protein [Lihuaxuella thermophila]|uniref:Uncharacterized protein n=1 Tax=Lihuaxuella thermophila TaxID=1173111 RepID=A0A1H8C736_9BACL|nr:hypothetical protein [Lihuaxuella thermophila]SEM89907.1 hypothetical protein SAMN05444955_10362 [Lihuaxuella thermophila]